MEKTIPLAALWTGRILKGLLCLFLVFDATMKIIKHAKSVEGTVQFGLSESSVPLLGFYLLVATVLYLIPKTSIYGILFLMAYLGGATAVALVAAEGAYLFPVAFAAFLIIAEYLQNINFRTILNFK